MIQHSTSGYFTRENKNFNMKSYVHCCIIYSGQDMETTEVFINGLMDKAM